MFLWILLCLTLNSNFKNRARLKLKGVYQYSFTHSELASRLVHKHVLVLYKRIPRIYNLNNYYRFFNCSVLPFTYYHRGPFYINFYVSLQPLFYLNVQTNYQAKLNFTNTFVTRSASCAKGRNENPVFAENPLIINK